MIKLLPPRAYGELKPLVNSQGNPIRVTAPPMLKKRRRRRRPGQPGTRKERNLYHV